jgi:Coenzyme PQQ synthesis protein D (PqqD)
MRDVSMGDPQPIGLRSVVVAAADVVSADLGREKALLSMTDGVYYGLNPVGAMIWDLVQQPRSVEELRDAVLARYRVEPDQCEKDVLAVLGKLSDWGLLEVRAATS